MGIGISSHPTHRPPHPPTEEARMSSGNGPTVEVPKEDVIDTIEDDDDMYPTGGSIIDSAMTPSSVGCNYVDGRR